VRKQGSGKKNASEKKAKTAITDSTLATMPFPQNVDWTVAGDIRSDEHMPLPPTDTRKLASLQAALANLAAEERSHNEQMRQQAFQMSCSQQRAGAHNELGAKE